MKYKPSRAGNCCAAARKHEPARDAKEVAQMFGYNSSIGLLAAVKRDEFPQADFTTPRISGGRPKAFWRVSTLMTEHKRRILQERTNAGT